MQAQFPKTVGCSYMSYLQEGEEGTPGTDGSETAPPPARASNPRYVTPRVRRSVMRIAGLPIFSICSPSFADALIGCPFTWHCTGWKRFPVSPGAGNDVILTEPCEDEC